MIRLTEGFVPWLVNRAQENALPFCGKHPPKTIDAAKLFGSGSTGPSNIRHVLTQKTLQWKQKLLFQDAQNLKISPSRQRRNGDQAGSDASDGVMIRRSLKPVISTR
jgi:hypothetical protein